MSGRNENRPKSTAEDRAKYKKAWAEMMVTIWREKIMRLHVVDTVLLHNDITENVTMGSSELTVIQHKFMEYGIYQDCGTGRGYEIDGQLYNDGHRGHNKGELKFLNPDLRGKNYVHRQKSGKITSGEPRKPREWFSRAYFASVMVLKEQMAYMYGEEFCGLLAEKIEEANHKRSTSMRSHLWGHHQKK